MNKTPTFIIIIIFWGVGGQESILEAKVGVKSVGEDHKETFIFCLLAYSAIGCSNFEAIYHDSNGN